MSPVRRGGTGIRSSRWAVAAARPSWHDRRLQPIPPARSQAPRAQCNPRPSRSVESPDPHSLPCDGRQSYAAVVISTRRQSCTWQPPASLIPLDDFTAAPAG